MTVSAFLATRGRVCVRCGLPAAARYGVDLVEPASGVATCLRCAPTVQMGVRLMLAGDEGLAKSFLEPPRKLRKQFREEREAKARELGWEPSAPKRARPLDAVSQEDQAR